MSISFSFSEDFQSPSLGRFQELNTRSIDAQDFEGVVPGEKYWGLLKVNEQGSVFLNLSGAPISQLSAWILSMRFKRAANGTNTTPGKTGRVASFGLLCQPVADEPNAINYSASVGLIMVGVLGSNETNGTTFAAIDGTLDNFKNISFFVPTSNATYVPFTTQVPNISVPKVTVPNVTVPTIPAVDLGSLASSIKTSIGSSLTSVMAGLASNPAVSKVTSLLGMVTGAASKLIAPDSLAALKTGASDLATNISSVATTATASTLASLKAAGASAPSVPPSVVATSPQLQDAAARVSEASVSIEPKVPSIKPSATSSPFFSFVMTYASGYINIVLDGNLIRSFPISQELMVALTNKPFVIGCETGNMRLQIDNISFSGNG